MRRSRSTAAGQQLVTQLVFAAGFGFYNHGTLSRLLPDYVEQKYLWQHADQPMMKQIQQRATEMIMGLKHLLDKEKLRELGLVSRDKRTLRRFFKYLMGGSKEHRTRLFRTVANNRTRGNEYKLKYNEFPLNIS